MESNSLLITRSSTCISRKWVAFKRKFSWNLLFWIFRILLIATLCFGSIWLFIKFKHVLLPNLTNLPNIVINKSQEKRQEILVDFTLAFYNTRKHYKMEKPKIDACKGKKIKLLVLVMSRRELLQRRMGIRYSYAKDAGKNMLVRFVVGGPVKDEEHSEKLENILNKEQEQYGDLVRYFNLPEGYDQLQFKTGAAFQWQQKFCPNAEFVMKIDDDSIIDLNRLDFWIEKKFRKQLKEAKTELGVFGYSWIDTKPIRDENSKWFLSKKVFPQKDLPHYMHGSGYFATGKAITAIMNIENTKSVYAIHIEDLLWNGILAERGDVVRFEGGNDHFLEGTLEDKEKCEDGKPIIFCLYQVALSSIKAYKEEYKKLHELKCLE
uniref:Hexosyltransferase n=1 Tax=Meloidogyne incognita TaxID=6306 RepID=A0A914LBJ9_MELIC